MHVNALVRLISYPTEALRYATDARSLASTHPNLNAPQHPSFLFEVQVRPDVICQAEKRTESNSDLVSAFCLSASSIIELQVSLGRLAASCEGAGVQSTSESNLNPRASSFCSKVTAKEQMGPFHPFIRSSPFS